MESEVGLLERTDELERLHGRLESAARGRGSICLIEGPAGIGKTALLETCREQATGAGLRALAARAGPLEHDLAWNVVRQLFSAVIAAPSMERAAFLSGAAALAAPALGLKPGAGVGALHGLYWLTVALAQERPLCLCVDDAHWGDSPSLGFLAYLGVRAADLPVVIILAVRHGEPAPEALEALAARPECERVRPRELTSAGSAALARRKLGAGAADEFCAACHEATSGNPFLLCELVDQLARDAVEPSAERAAEVARITPETIKRTVLLRLSRLTPPARALADALAVLGGEAPMQTAAALAGLDADHAASAADALVAAGLLCEGPRPVYVHALVREVVYSAIPEHRRARAHHEAARLLAHSGVGPGLIALQLLASEPEGDRWVVERLRAAANAALDEGAPLIASDHLERALAEPPAESDRAEVLIQLGRAELAAGRPTATERLAEAAALVTEPGDRARVLLDLSRSLYITGRSAEAAGILDRALKELAGEGAVHRPLAAEIQATWLGVARTEAPLRGRAAELVRELVKHPPEGGSYGERALLAQIASELTFAGEPRPTPLELARLAVGDGELIAQESSDGFMWQAAAGALGWGDDFDAYERLHDWVMEDARRRGSLVGFVGASYGASFTHYYRGMLSAAAADCEQAISAGQFGSIHVLTAARAQLAWALLERDQLDDATASLEAATRDPNWDRSTARALVLEAKSRLHLARGENEQALDAALQAGRVLDEAAIANPSISPWRSRAAAAAAFLGDRQRAEELLSDELRLAHRFGAPRPIGVALLSAGIVRGTRGVEALEQAVKVLADSPARLEYTRALVHLGAALRRRGNLKVARNVLRQALEESIACDSVLLERRALAELDAAGARPRHKRASGIEALTPAEQRVAELAASGIRNRDIAQALFVSLRTVETHLTHAYGKLDIASRAELRTALTRTSNNA